MRNPAILALFVSSAGISADAQSFQAPVLQWYKSISGTGTSSVTGVATDSQGNFYVAGTTTSLDLPTIAAAQGHPGGSPLLRINAASGSSSYVYGTGLAGTSSISANPENPNTLYAIAGASLSRSMDGGNTWTPLTGFPTVTTVNTLQTQIISLTVDPTDGNTLYAATQPLGVLKSTDAGASWTATNNGIPQYLPGTDDFVAFQVFVDPNSPAVVFCSVDAANLGGLYRSTDHGASWSATNGPNFGSLSFDPFTPGTIYAYGVKSIDDGQTWTPFFPGYSVLPDPFHQGTIYGYGYFDNALYESTDSGLTWNLKINKSVAVLVADPNRPALYAIIGNTIVRSTDGFTTYSSIGPSQSLVFQNLQLPGLLVVAGPFLYVVTSSSSDVFVAKLDPNGAVLYSTYFGGNGDETAVGMAVGNDGSVYVAGQTASPDFPVTPGVYSTTPPAANQNSNFVFKLNPSGALAWSTFFYASTVIFNSPYPSTVTAIALDASGSPYIAGTTYGGLPLTPGAYLQQPPTPPPPCTAFPACATLVGGSFLTKFNPQGSALTFSTYLSDNNETVNSIVVGPNGNAYIAGYSIFLMNATGSELLNATNLGQYSFLALSVALDASGNVYATGATSDFADFPATAAAFQTSPSPRPGNSSNSGIPSDAFVIKFDGSLTHVLAATLLGGAQTDGGTGVAIDLSTGNVIVSGYADSLDFPTRAPFQGSFAARSGFVAGLDPSLSQLLFSTYLGSQPFSATAVPDHQGNILVAGTATQSNASSAGSSVIVNKIALSPAPAVRIDAVLNAASQLGQPLAPGENVAVMGAGFGPDAQLFVDDVAIPVVLVSPSQVIAVMPLDAPTSGARRVTVSSGGANSNTMYMPSATVSPAVYSVNGTGAGQGYILNADGTVNSPSNPTAPGAPITIFATGVGQIGTVDGYAVTALPVSVFVDGVYADGIAAFMKQVQNLPGNIYELSVFAPTEINAFNPLPPQSPITLVLGGVSSQAGITLYVK